MVISEFMLVYLAEKQDLTDAEVVYAIRNGKTRDRRTMRQLPLLLTALLAEISWTHHLIILEKCKDPLERELYIRTSKRHSWSYRVLMNQISNQTYEKTMTSQTNFDKNLPERLRPEAKLAMKDDYAFSFLELDEEHSEHELERAILCR
jgi:hypothetical protein